MNNNNKDNRVTKSDLVSDIASVFAGILTVSRIYKKVDAFVVFPG